MTQMQAPTFEAPNAASTGEPVRTSGLAITALICSLIFCCPCTTIVGVLLGVIAIPVISGNPARKGKGMALIAIVIGLVATVVQFMGGRWYYGNIVLPVTEGPKVALVAGFAGDAQGFKDEMFGAAAQASDAEVQAFIDQLRSRYGEFQGCTLDEASMGGMPMGSQSVSMPYILEFSGGSVPAKTTMSPVDAQGQFLGKMKFSEITITDADRGDITFPPGGAGSPTGGGPSIPEAIEGAIEEAVEGATGAPDASGG